MIQQLTEGNYLLIEATIRNRSQAVNYNEKTKKFDKIFKFHVKGYEPQSYLISPLVTDSLFFFSDSFIYILSLNKPFRYILAERINFREKRIEDLFFCEYHSDNGTYKSLAKLEPIQIISTIIHEILKQNEKSN